MRRPLALIVIAILVVFAPLPLPGEPAGDTSAPVICIVPLGKHDKTLIPYARRGIEYLYGFGTKTLEPADMPPSAWYARNRRHRADAILDFLDGKAESHPGCTALIGFTSLDISTTKGRVYDWGIFGLGEMPGKSAVVSDFRLRRKGASAKLVRIRVVKVMTHELGHVLGLPHCPTPRCNLNDAKGTIVTVDNETGLLCDSCRRRIEERFNVKVQARQEFDWEKVLAE